MLRATVRRDMGVVSLPYFDPSGNFYRDSLLLANDINKFGMDIRSFSVPLNRSLRRVIIPSIKKNFKQQGRPQRWVPLAEATVRIRGSDRPILRRTGKLMRTATQLNIWKVDRDSATIVGLDQRVPYTQYHQRGTVNIPQRAFILYQLADELAIQDIFYRWIIERSKARGWK